MASMKNTIVLGCFILAGFAVHAHLTRYEKGHAGDIFSYYRFDKMTGHHEKFFKSEKRWKVFGLPK
mgnify:CR=1 FL=1|tara:strand:+ start:111 stop:308 length:198 start_codon:yes stop_codon:yes gene_type:complete